MATAPRSIHGVEELRAMDTPPHRARLEGKVECHLPDIPHCKGRWVVSPLISDPILSFSTSFLGTLACSLCASGVRCCRWVLAARVSEMPEPPQLIPWRQRPRYSKRSNGSTASHRALEPQGTPHQHLQEGIRRPRASLSLPPGWTWVVVARASKIPELPQLIHLRRQSR